MVETYSMLFHLPFTLSTNRCHQLNLHKDFKIISLDSFILQRDDNILTSELVV